MVDKVKLWSTIEDRARRITKPMRLVALPMSDGGLAADAAYSEPCH
jgi:hypothetical protein